MKLANGIYNVNRRLIIIANFIILHEPLESHLHETPPFWLPHTTDTTKCVCCPGGIRSGARTRRPGQIF